MNYPPHIARLLLTGAAVVLVGGARAQEPEPPAEIPAATEPRSAVPP